MKKVKNNNGFVLIETIVTAVFVLGFFTFIIVNILPLVGEYERVEDYDTVDAVYETHLIRKMILKNNSATLTKLFTYPTSYISDVNNYGYYYEFEGTDLCYFLSNYNYCKKLLSSSFLDVNKIIITDFDTGALKNYAKNHEEMFDRNVFEYLKYIPNYYKDCPKDLSSSFCFRRLIVVYNDGRISNLELVDYDFSCGGGCFYGNPKEH